MELKRYPAAFGPDIRNQNYNYLMEETRNAPHEGLNH